MVAVVSFAAEASPFMNNRSLSDSISSPVRQALIYAKEGSRKLIDGRWNLSQSKSKLGIELSADEKQQLMACTGEILCEKARDDDPGDEVPPAPITASAVSVLRPDLLVTAKHVLFKGKKRWCPLAIAASAATCTEGPPFQSVSRRTKGGDTFSITKISSSFVSSVN
jgi:hypothetical protein